MPLQEIGLRLLLAIVIGGVIGYERESTNSPAGFRTHILVALGATVISLIQVEMVNKSIVLITADPNLSNSLKIDMGRLGAQVVSGVGFLGAGTIIHTKGSIKGLTTAASLWVVACVGLAIGFGYYSISILAGIAIVLVLVTLKRFENKFITNRGLCKIYIEYINKQEAMNCIEVYMLKKGIKIANIEFYVNDTSELDKIKSCLITIEVPKAMSINEVLVQCSTNEYITQIYELKE